MTHFLSRLLVFLSIFLVIFLRVNNVYALNSLEENFDSELSSRIWAVEVNGGSVEVTDGVLKLSAPPGASYPYLYLINSPEYLSGDFVFETKVKFAGPLNYGFGLNLTNSLPQNNTSSDLGWNDVIFLLWPSPNGAFSLYSTPCPTTTQSCTNDQFNGPITSASWGGWHVFKISRAGDKYYAFIDGSQIFESKPSLKFATQIWLGNPQRTGGVLWGTLFVDYIKVNAEESPEPEGRKPVVVIPGLGASWDFDAILTGTAGNNWTIPGFVNLYDNLIDSLENAGYVRNEDLFIFTYDWRKPLYSLAEDLRGYIDGLIDDGKIGTDERVDFIGHSYGGLVARTYGQRIGTEKIDKIITAGSPHQGIVDSYSIWEGARVTKNVWWQKAALELTTKLNQRSGERKVDTVRRLAPGIRDTLPTFDFRKLDEEVLPSSEMAQKNQTLLDMNGSFATVNELLFVNAGTGNETDRFVSIRQRDWRERSLGLWEDGKPTEFEQDEDGDGAVLGLSSLFDFSNQTTTNADHEDIISSQEALTNIFEQLGLDESKVVANGVDKRKRVFIAALRSPGVLRVCRLDVCDSDLGIYLPDQKLFFLPDYPDGALDIRVSAEGETGSYRLYLGQLFEDTAAWRDVTGNLRSGSQIDNYQVINDDEIEVMGDEQTQTRTIQEDANRLNSLLTGWDKKNLLAIAISTSQPTSKRIVAIRQLREILSAQAIKAYKANRSDRIEAVITLWQDLDTLAKEIIGVGNTTKPAVLNINISAVETYKLLADRLLSGSSSYFAARFYELFETNFAEAKSIRGDNRDLSLDLVLSARYLLITALGVR